MTALVGVFGTGAPETGSTSRGTSQSLAAMLSRMRNRGAAVPERFAAPGVCLAACRHEWEVGEHGWMGPALTVADDWVVAADASLYYLADLRRELRRHSLVPDGATSGELLLAALRAWGDRFARRIEGDFAIIATHRQSGRVLLARDFIGKRGLSYSLTSDRTLVVASSPRAVIEYPGVPRALNTDFIAASISGLHGHGSRTAFSSVSVVPGGATLAFDSGELTLVDQWSPPAFSSNWEDQPSEEAAEQLRHLIEEAVYERLPEGLSSVWMSGGWDSTSVFAAGRSALARRGSRSHRLQPISLRYPEGDTGDESALIETVAQRWRTNVRWVPVDGINVFEDAERRASVRDDPRVHPFESQIRTLCRVSRELGIRIAHDGAGGDHLFTVSTAAILADHLRAARVGLLWSEFKAWGRRNLYTFARSIILPQLSAPTLQWIGAVRGRPLPGFWDSAVPPWVRVTPGLLREAAAEQTREPSEGVSAWETRDMLTSPLVARALSWNHAIALEEGILLRSPLFDRRVIVFAATRPLNERLGGPDSKVLLRRSMRGLLPAELLEPRGRKTGTPVDYFRREMTSSGHRELERFFAAGTIRLADMGIVDLQALRNSIAEYRKSPSHGAGALLQLTLEAERWLAGQESEE